MGIRLESGPARSGKQLSSRARPIPNGGPNRSSVIRPGHLHDNHLLPTRCRIALITVVAGGLACGKELQPGRLPHRRNRVVQPGQVRVRLGPAPQKNSFVVVAGVSPALAKAAKRIGDQRPPQRLDLIYSRRAIYFVTFCTRDDNGFLILKKKRKLLSKPTLNADKKNLVRP